MLRTYNAKPGIICLRLVCISSMICLLLCYKINQSPSHHTSDYIFFSFFMCFVCLCFPFLHPCI
ncbi:hypothetical protein OIU79_015549 [Salix purpurea]|uniref:Uncharacterized protein n=1 Tax=Salix purpurea TaxID=77065 RepID=A0A9Q0PD11_SALPP|nr:hypothetical protein OIU79_015549 [Salix purpurea]